MCLDLIVCLYFFLVHVSSCPANTNHTRICNDTCIRCASSSVLCFRNRSPHHHRYYCHYYYLCYYYYHYYYVHHHYYYYYILLSLLLNSNLIWQTIRPRVISTSPWFGHQATGSVACFMTGCIAGSSASRAMLPSCKLET